MTPLYHIYYLPEPALQLRFDILQESVLYEVQSSLLVVSSPLKI